MHLANLMTIREIIQTAAIEADNLANTLQHEAPEAAVKVLNDLDEVAGCIGLNDLLSIEAAVKLYSAANYLRQTFPRFSIGHESADCLSHAAASLAARAAL